MHTIYKVILGLGVFGLFHNAVLAADLSAGEQKAKVCFGCHGQNGNSANPAVPILAGQQAAYLNNQITAFRDNKRNNPVMSSQAKGLSDAEIVNIAAYFAAQTAKSAGGNSTLATAGATKASQCTGCHTAKFAGRTAIPKLAGQQSVYLAKQLHQFKNGERKSGPMQVITANLSDTDIEQLAAFLGTLQ